MIVILLLVFGTVIFLWRQNKKNLKSEITDLTNRVKTLEKEKENLSLIITDLENKNEKLSKYQAVVDIEGTIEQLIFHAKTKARIIVDQAKKEQGLIKEEMQIMQEQARKELGQALISATAIKEQATADAIAVEQNSQKLISNAGVEAKLIVENAETNAKEIAGEAYKAMQNVDEYEKTAKAMKNIIEGYGNKYLVPTYSLLDDLAEEFKHKEAGEKLKQSRDQTYQLIKNGGATKCEYVDEERRTTAQHFVLDAFNGKVDSILSKVKKDNYGTLERKIKDAFQIVNNNGKAFRNASITLVFLNARLKELKWAIITQELKWEEQEEQRRIKEQIREEEKVRKEYEKAIKEAQKEEDTLKKLIEKAQREVTLASEEQKYQYEEKLRELNLKLQLAEDKNKRAISMAQQTKQGHVYVISNIGSFGDNVYKIGMTRRLEPEDRVKELGDASVPFEFDVHAMIKHENAPWLEKELHRKFMRLQVNKVNPRKEFFKVMLADVKKVVDEMKISTKWTLTAEAKHYNESLVLEEQLKTDKQKEIEWETRQLKMEAVVAKENEEVDV